MNRATFRLVSTTWTPAPITLPAPARPFPWRLVLTWTGWIILLLIPVSFILHHELTTAGPGRAQHDQLLQKVDADRAKAEQLLRNIEAAR